MTRSTRASSWWAASTLLVVLLCANNALYSHAAVAVDSQELIELNEANWQRMLKGEWMVEFFAPWCPACKNLAPTWERFAVSAGILKVNVAKIDVTTSPSLSGRFFVTALPTIYHVKDGEFRQYRGSRDGDALVYFLQQKQWQTIEPISAWKKPDTIHMSVLSYFFKLSHTLKDFNVRLQEEYGLPTWGSYALFALGTIFVGAALGLMLVCLVDFLYPPKKVQRQSFSASKEAQANSVEDLAKEEIEDEEEDDDEEEEDYEEDEDDEAEGAGNDEAEDDQQQRNDDDEDETSEGEKNSHSESEDSPVAQQPQPVSEPAKPAKGNSDVRKRKPRKAD